MSFDIAESPPSFEAISKDDNGPARPCDFEQLCKPESGTEKEATVVKPIAKDLSSGPLPAPAGDPIQPAAAAVQVYSLGLVYHVGIWWCL